jgi:hypothetical protein
METLIKVKLYNLITITVFSIDTCSSDNYVDVLLPGLNLKLSYVT